MAGWFDRVAKQSAQREGNSRVGRQANISRRRLIAGGSAAVGVAWTAPMLVGVQPAYAGASECTGQDIYTVCPNGTSYRCCPPGTTCLADAANPGSFVCQVPLGGTCGNQGLGQCNGNTSRCNQPGGNPNQNPSICGGPGTTCSDGSLCMTTSPCSEVSLGGDGRCGGAGSPCLSDANCSKDTNGLPALTCQSGFCAA